MRRVITIDGPAASGKSSVSRDISCQMGWSWVSTGAFYRAIAYLASIRNIDLKDPNSEKILCEMCYSSCWEVRLSPEKTLVFSDEKDISDKIYGEDIGAYASMISSKPKVREALLSLQRACAEGNETEILIAEGRDCGTVVFPNAEVKIYLTARGDHRALRRAKEEGKSFQETYEAQSLRDTQDSERSTAPLRIPPEAHIIETSDMDLSEVVQKVKTFVLETLT